MENNVILLVKAQKKYRKNTKCSICGSEKLRFLKNQEARGILRNSGLKILLSKIPLLGDILFWNYKVNENVNECLLAGDTFMLEMHLKHLQKSKERIQKFKETGDLRCIYKNELDKACFQHDMFYWDFKDLARRTASDKRLTAKAFYIAKNAEYDGYQRGLASMVNKFFDKKTFGEVIKSISSQQLVNELHKPIIKKF